MGCRHDPNQAKECSMKVKTKVKAGGIHFNHNVTVKRVNYM
jgi:hypothetical protein